MFFEIIFGLLHETLSIPVLSKNAPRMIAFIVVTKLARLIVFHVRRVWDF